MISGVLEAGCDEAGRGPLAGSVFAAAVILPPSFGHSLPLEGEPEGAVLNDSKQLTDHQRRALRPIIEREALAWAVAEVTPEEIDRLNILNASILAMQRALDQIIASPFFKDHPERTLQHIIVDGNRWKPYVPEGEIMAIPADTVVKGDATYMSIAAASILAKTYRDDYMLRLHELYPQYGWDENKGYPTPQHYAAIRRFGPSPFHRQSFNMHLSTQNSSNEGSSFNSSPKVGVKQSPAVCGSIWDCDREPVALVAREAIVRRKEDLSQVAALLTEEYVKNK